MAIVATAAAFRITIPTIVKATGVVEPLRIVALRAPFSGAVVQLAVRSGDTVRVGQLVAVMDSTLEASAMLDLESKIEVKSNDAVRTATLAHYERLEAASSVEQADSRLRRTKIVLRQRLADYERPQTDSDSLLDHHVYGVHVGIDAAVSDVREAELSLKSARLLLERSLQKNFDSLSYSVELKGLREQLRRRMTVLARSRMLSPITGTVLNEETDGIVGAPFREGDVVVEIAELGDWHVELKVPEQFAHRVHVGDSAVLRLSAFSDLEQGPIRSRVINVGSTIGTLHNSRNTVGVGSVTQSALSVPSLRVQVSVDHRQLQAPALAAIRKGNTVEVTIISRRRTVVQLARDWFSTKVARRLTTIGRASL